MFIQRRQPAWISAPHPYGPTAQGANYGLLFTAFGLAGFCGPYVGGILKDNTGMYYIPFILGTILVAISFISTFFINAPQKKYQHK